jgi:hypothetical protein
MTKYAVNQGEAMAEVRRLLGLPSGTTWFRLTCAADELPLVECTYNPEEQELMTDVKRVEVEKKLRKAFGGLKAQ